MEKKPTSHMAVGLMISLVLIVIFIIFYVSGQAFNKGGISWLPTLFFVGAIIYAIIKFAKDKDHNVTFGSCFSYGFKATAIVAIIMAAFLLIFLLIFPEYKEEFIEFMRRELENNPNTSDDQIDQSLDMMSRFFMISAIGGGLFMNLITGAIASLIGAAVAKKNPQTPFQNTAV